MQSPILRREFAAQAMVTRRGLQWVPMTVGELGGEIERAAHEYRALRHTRPSCEHWEGIDYSSPVSPHMRRRPDCHRRPAVHVLPPVRRSARTCPRMATVVGATLALALVSSDTIDLSAAIEVTSPVPLTAGLCDTCAGAITLPLKVTGVPPAELANLTARVISVQFGEESDGSLLTLIKANIENPATLPALILIVHDNSRFRRVAAVRWS